MISKVEGPMRCFYSGGVAVHTPPSINLLLPSINLFLLRPEYESLHYNFFKLLQTVHVHGLCQSLHVAAGQV